MLIFNRQAALTAHLKEVANPAQTIGFVPTMGALHDGHLSLLKRSLSENPITVISIFVNPTQFNNSDDLKAYPRTLDSDVAKIQMLNSDIIVFAPEVDDMYPGNTIAVSFDYDGLENVMEGAFRPGHFDGVGTIVKRLFEIVKPTNAYFGEKDFQQLQIIRKMVQKLGISVNVVACPIFRENNGLAMSSRNERLTASERASAGIIYSTLKSAKALFGTETVEGVTAMVGKIFSTQHDFKMEYFMIADEDTLQPAIIKKPNIKYRAFIAVFVNNIRLIDTISLN